MTDLSIAADTLAWDKQGGLLPAVVQDADTLKVLMLGYMDRAALQATLDTGRVTFFSRSRQRLWTKGESSGHVLELVAIEHDFEASDEDVEELLTLMRIRAFARSARRELETVAFHLASICRQVLDGDAGRCRRPCRPLAAPDQRLAFVSLGLAADDGDRRAIEIREVVQRLDR